MGWNWDVKSVWFESPAHPCLIQPFLSLQTPPSQISHKMAAFPPRLSIPQVPTQLGTNPACRGCVMSLLCTYRLFKSSPLEGPCDFFPALILHLILWGLENSPGKLCPYIPDFFFLFIWLDLAYFLAGETYYWGTGNL